MVETISYSLSRESEYVYIDTRSPGEFEGDHIPGAVNIPIFNNEERKIVGTIYTKESVDKAVATGTDIYQKKIDLIKKDLAKYKDNHVIIYCWRGGMRSKTITELAVNLGLDAVQLKGGYKGYRKYVRDQMLTYKLKPILIVLHGLTGTGKTEIVNNFKDSIDLEGLAKHRSSLYGAIGLNPRTQKMFETLLLQKLNDLADRKYIVVEGESRKIGNIIIPEFFWKAMKKGINIRVNASMKERIKRLAAIYADDKDSIQELKSITKGLRQKLTGKVTDELVGFLDNNKIEDFMEGMLIHYYDPLYSHSIDELKYEFEITVDSCASLNDHYNVV